MLVKFSPTLWVVYVPPKLNSGQNYCSLLKLTHCIYGSAEGKMELLEPGRRTQGVCTKETIQLSVIKPQVLLPFQGHLESPSFKWPKFPLSPWGVKTHCHQMKKGEEHGKKWPRPILFICFQGKNTGMRHRHFLMTWMIQCNKWKQPGECSAPKGQSNICQCSSSANVWGC